LHLTITNDLDSSTSLPKGTGIGLRNVMDRLFIIYRKRDLFKTKQEKNLFEAHLIIPQYPTS
ncbi:MAG: sensor histidine kinase, partial [Cytophagales bacterium]|nr:sensor histidine kinase [Cytophagales bacterium]